MKVADNTGQVLRLFTEEYNMFHGIFLVFLYLLAYTVFQTPQRTLKPTPPYRED